MQGVALSSISALDRVCGEVAEYLAGGAGRALTGLLRVGVIGEVRVAGGHMPDLVLAKSPHRDGWDLGASYKKMSKRTS